MLRRCVSSEEGRGLELIRRLNLPRDKEEKVYTGNARRLVKLDARLPGWSAMTVIGTNRTSRHVRCLVANGTKADIELEMNS